MHEFLKSTRFFVNLNILLSLIMSVLLFSSDINNLRYYYLILNIIDKFNNLAIENNNTSVDSSINITYNNIKFMDDLRSFIKANNYTFIDDSICFSDITQYRIFQNDNIKIKTINNILLDSITTSVVFIPDPIDYFNLFNYHFANKDIVQIDNIEFVFKNNHHIPTEVYNAILNKQDNIHRRSLIFYTTSMNGKKENIVLNDIKGQFIKHKNFNIINNIHHKINNIDKLSSDLKEKIDDSSFRIIWNNIYDYDIDKAKIYIQDRINQVGNNLSILGYQFGSINNFIVGFIVILYINLQIYLNLRFINSNKNFKNTTISLPFTLLYDNFISTTLMTLSILIIPITPIIIYILLHIYQNIIQFIVILIIYSTIIIISYLNLCYISHIKQRYINSI